MAEGPGASKVAIVDALVLAFSHSSAKEVVGTDALRMVVTGQYRDLTQDGDFNLEPVWELLEGQPGFSPEHCYPPLCRFHSWSDALGIEVRLPEVLASLRPAERKELARRCAVPDGALESTLEAGSRAARETQQPPSRSKSPTASFVKTDEDAKPRRPGLELAAALVAVLTFSFVGLTVYRAFSGAHWETASADLGGDIPVASAEKLGSEVGVTLSDDSWFSLPEATRRGHMDLALKRLSAKGVTVLFVRDKSGRIRATAQWFGKPPKPSIKFR